MIMSLLVAYLHVCVETSPNSYPHLEIFRTTLDMMYKSLGSASFRSLALAHVGSHRSMGLSMFGGILVRPGLGGFVGFLSWVGVGESNTRLSMAPPVQDPAESTPPAEQQRFFRSADLPPRPLGNRFPQVTREEWSSHHRTTPRPRTTPRTHTPLPVPAAPAAAAIRARPRPRTPARAHARRRTLVAPCVTSLTPLILS